MSVRPMTTAIGRRSLVRILGAAGAALTFTSAIAEDEKSQGDAAAPSRPSGLRQEYLNLRKTLMEDFKRKQDAGVYHNAPEVEEQELKVVKVISAVYRKYAAGEYGNILDQLDQCLQQHGDKQAIKALQDSQRAERARLHASEAKFGEMLQADQITSDELREMRKLRFQVDQAYASKFEKLGAVDESSLAQLDGVLLHPEQCRPLVVQALMYEHNNIMPSLEATWLKNSSE